MRRKSTLIMLSLWLFAAVSAGYLLFGKQKSEGVLLDVSSETQEAEQPLTATSTLESANYTGQAEDGTRWQIHANYAESIGSAKNTTANLKVINATLTSNAQSITLNAKQGTYHRISNTLVLANNVAVTSQGLTLKTEELTANLKTQILTSNTQTQLVGQSDSWQSLISGQNLFVDLKTRVVTFTGNTRTTLTPIGKP